MDDEDLVTWVRYVDLISAFFFCETRSALLKECVNKFYMLQGKKTEIWNPNFILCEF